MINVFADNDDVLAKAKGVACTSSGACERASLDRTPFAQTFVFRTTQGSVTVRCARGAVFFGEYDCVKH